MSSQPRAVLYLRLSVAADEVSTSLSRQEDDLRNHAVREGWEVVRVLTDDGISGRKARAKAEEALRMIRDGEADVLAVWKLDRWTRGGLSEIGKLKDALRSTPGALFFALQDGLRSDQAAFGIIAAVLSEVAETEATNTGLRVRSSIDRLRRSGRFPGGRVPFGYRTAPSPDGPGRILEPDPREARIVREVADRIIAGESRTKLSLWLNDEKVPTASSPYRTAVAAGRDPEGLSRGNWHVSTVAVVWTGDALLGRVTHRDRLLTDDDGLPAQVWEPILDQATLSKLRARMRNPRVKGTTPPKRVRAARLLSGLVFCDYCGKKMRTHSSNGAPIYACQTLATGIFCENPRIHAIPFESYVEKVYLSVVGNHPELEIVETVTDPSTLEELAAVEVAIRDAQLAFQPGADYAALGARMERLTFRREQLLAVPASITESARETGRTYREAWFADEDVDRRRQLLSSSLDQISVRRSVKRGRAFDHARITLHWDDEADLAMQAWT
ncbi:recombinase family protein [Leifsonia sp. NPDC058248]|uniref:recombinase family protein n=1 Tax=Leifsonia sp. NPDC058248 TaxID=3346402 RepID=UPI0036D7769F